MICVLLPAFASDTQPGHEDTLALYDALLRRHVVDGQVDYAGFAGDGGFVAYLDDISRADPGGFESRDKELAFYINAYNALNIRAILDGASPSNLFSRLRYFKLTRFAVAGEQLSLSELQEERIRPQEDPRLHFAIVSACASCPALRNEAYRAAMLDRQLDEAAIAFINDAAINTIDAETRSANVSKLFKWYAADFSKEQDSVAAYLAFYLRNAAQAAALRSGEYRIRYRAYDWSLNGVKP